MEPAFVADYAGLRRKSAYRQISSTPRTELTPMSGALNLRLGWEDFMAESSEGVVSSYGKTSINGELLPTLDLHSAHREGVFSAILLLCLSRLSCFGPPLS